MAKASVELRSLLNPANRPSSSWSARTSRTWNVNPSAAAAFAVSASILGFGGVLASRSRPTRDTLGATSLSSRTHFSLSPSSTRPVPIRSPAAILTIGIVCVASFAA